MELISSRKNSTDPFIEIRLNIKKKYCQKDENDFPIGHSFHVGLSGAHNSQ